MTQRSFILPGRTCLNLLVGSSLYAKATQVFEKIDWPPEAEVLVIVIQRDQPNAVASKSAQQVVDNSEGDCLSRAYCGLSDRLSGIAWAFQFSAALDSIKQVLEIKPDWNMDKEAEVLVGIIRDVLEYDLPLPKFVHRLRGGCHEYRGR